VAKAGAKLQVAGGKVVQNGAMWLSGAPATAHPPSTLAGPGQDHDWELPGRARGLQHQGQWAEVQGAREACGYCTQLEL